MANKVYDYSLYTWQDFSLTYDNFTPEALAKAWGLPVQDIVFNGSKTWTGTGWYIDSSFSVIINNLDSRFWLLKASQTSGQNIHPTQQSGKSIILTFPSCIINELSLGEQTAYKVYNSYRWYNQQLEQNESYWPYGCILSTQPNMVPPNSNTIVEIELRSPISQYLIPSFMVQSHNIGGWGSKDPLYPELSVNEGYQQQEIITRFQTNKPWKMWFLTKQLSNPPYTILYNGWDWTQTEWHVPTIAIQDNQIYLDGECVYILQDNDELVRYRFSDSPLHSFNSRRDKGPLCIGEKFDSDDDPYYPQGQPLSLAYAWRPNGYVSKLTLTRGVAPTVYYDLQFGDDLELASYDLSTQTWINLNPNTESYNCYIYPINYTNWTYKSKYQTSEESIQSSIGIVGLVAVDSKPIDFTLSIKLKNIPCWEGYLYQWQTRHITPINSNKIEWRYTPHTTNTDFAWHPHNFDAFNQTALLDQVSFPIFEQQNLRTWYSGDTSHFIMLKGQTGLSSQLSMNVYPGHMQREQRDFYMYVVWHFHPNQPEDDLSSSNNPPSSATPFYLH